MEDTRTRRVIRVIFLAEWREERREKKKLLLSKVVLLFTPKCSVVVAAAAAKRRERERRRVNVIHVSICGHMPACVRVTHTRTLTCTNTHGMRRKHSDFCGHDNFAVVRANTNDKWIWLCMDWDFFAVDILPLVADECKRNGMIRCKIRGPTIVRLWVMARSRFVCQARTYSRTPLRDQCGGQQTWTLTRARSMCKYLWFVHTHRFLFSRFDFWNFFFFSSWLSIEGRRSRENEEVVITIDSKLI